MSNKVNCSLTFTNSNYLNNKKISNNMVKSRLISNLKKAEKILSDDKFKKLQSSLIVNLKNNNTIIANINNNNYKLDIIGGDMNIPVSKTNNPQPIIANPVLKTQTNNQEAVKSTVEQVPLVNSNNKKKLNNQISVKSTIEPVPQVNSNNKLNNQIPVKSTIEPIPQVNSNSIKPKNNIPEEHTISQATSESESPTISTDESTYTTSTYNQHPVDSTTETISDSIDLDPTKDSLTNSSRESMDDSIDTKPEIESSIDPTKSSTNETDSNPSLESNKETMPITQSTEKKKTVFNHIKGFFGMQGGMEYSSDTEDGNTYFFDSNDSDEESILDNLKNKKYLKSLNVKELRDISKKNELVLSKGGCYLKKDQLVKQIYKKFKNN